MSLQLHTCPVPGCREDLAVRITMCPRHWELVPEAKRAELNRAWRNTRGGYAPALNAFSQVLAAAIAAAEAAEEVQLEQLVAGDGGLSGEGIPL